MADDEDSDMAKDERWTLLTWLADEDFWKDVTKSVISGLILASVIYFGAVLAGYIGQPSTRFATLLSLVLVPLWAWLLFMIIRDAFRIQQTRLQLVRVVALAGLITGFFAEIVLSLWLDPSAMKYLRELFTI